MHGSDYTLATLIIDGFSQAPEQISSALGIEPSETALAGQLVGSTWRSKTETRTHRTNAWYLDSSRESSFQDAVCELAEHIVSKKKQFLSLPDEVGVEVFVTVAAQDAYPAIDLPDWAVQALADIGAGISIRFA